MLPLPQAGLQKRQHAEALPAAKQKALADARLQGSVACGGLFGGKLVACLLP